jgi:AbrB family looped-hinge helix DNA binding protein
MSRITKLSTKGQIVLPKSLRTARRWKPGTEFIIEEQPDGILLKPKKPKGSVSWTDLIGIAGYRGPRQTIKQMNEGVAKEALKHS